MKKISIVVLSAMALGIYALSNPHVNFQLQSFTRDWFPRYLDIIGISLAVLLAFAARKAELKKVEKK